jgi:hypothetical protein
MRSIGVLGLAAALLGGVAPARAQQDTIPQEIADVRLPDAVAERVVAFFNDPATLHFSGRTRIPADGVVRGNVAVMDGPATVAGRVEGNLVVINGDLELVPGASVTGSVTVVGGQAAGAAQARVGGAVHVYAAPLEFAREGDAIAVREPDAVADSVEAGESVLAERRRSVRLVLTSEGSYNRVEGLPIAVGPVVETPGRFPLRVRARAIIRTEADGPYEAERWGGDVTAEQSLGWLRVGGALRSVVAPVEAWHLPDLENSLSTFVLRRDFRDYYQRQGGSAWVRVAPEGSPLSVGVEVRADRHRPLAAADPWTLIRRDDPWRLQPFAAQGDLTSVMASLRWDGRSSPVDPATGWYVDGQVERALRSTLRQPAFVSTPVRPGGAAGTVPRRDFGRFTHAFAEVRRYNRLSPTSRLDMRVLAAGALGRGELPPQRQHALGGEGSLPGFSHLSLDCGARTRVVRRLPNPTDALEQPAFFGAYGCRRTALVQVEYRGNVDFRLDFGRPDDDSPARGASSRSTFGWNGALGWAVFADGGYGWGSAQSPVARQGAADVGAGLLLGRAGVYGAIPVGREGEYVRGQRTPRLFIRLTSRF